MSWNRDHELGGHSDRLPVGVVEYVVLNVVIYVRSYWMGQDGGPSRVPLVTRNTVVIDLPLT